MLKPAAQKSEFISEKNKMAEWGAWFGVQLQEGVKGVKR